MYSDAVRTRVMSGERPPTEQYAGGDVPWEYVALMEECMYV